MKNRFSRWPNWRKSWISDRKNSSYKSLQSFLSRFESVALSVQEKKKKIDFQDGRHEFPMETILASFDLHATTILPSKFRLCWPFGSWFRRRGEK